MRAQVCRTSRVDVGVGCEHTVLQGLLSAELLLLRLANDVKQVGEALAVAGNPVMVMAYLVRSSTVDAPRVVVVHGSLLL